MTSCGRVRVLSHPVLERQDGGVADHAVLDLDRAVDRLYRAKPFADDAERVALLLKRYQALVG